ncbi:MAG: flagellum-specific ATP synthase FliI, partial [Planctomycetota bacterium]
MTLATQFPRRRTANQLRSSLDAMYAGSCMGTVSSIQSAVIQVVGIRAPIGACCEVLGRNQNSLARVVGHHNDALLVCPVQGTTGIMAGDRVQLRSNRFLVPVGDEYLGRVVDCSGNPVDYEHSIAWEKKLDLASSAPTSISRAPISEILETGVKAIDAFATLGRGQRIGLFAGAGVGKSQLMGMIARGTNADVVVIALVGERGREVSEFLDNELTPELRNKCVTVVATSDQSPMQRVQAAQAATAISEYFRSRGKDVLLLMDSVTRFATAQRELGLSVGEVPTTRGLPPSVFSE